MRVKDIEQRLKKEHEQSRVPDVLARAKQTPINRLKDGQLPLKAFNRRDTVLVLWLAMLLLIVIVFALGTVLLIPSANASVEYDYVRVRIASDGNEKTYGVVLADMSDVVLLVLEKENSSSVMTLCSVGEKDVKLSISAVYLPKSNDKISVIAFGDDSQASLSASVVADALRAIIAVDVVDASVSIKTSDASELDSWRSVIDGATDTDSVDELIAKYLSAFS